MMRLGVQLDTCISSPLTRARQTAEIVWSQLGDGSPFAVVEALLPGALPDAVTEEILLSEGESVLVVGHMPDLCHMAAHLSSRQSRRVSSMMPGTVACLEFNGAVVAHGGTVCWVKRTSELAAEAGISV
jgi:phosphohistidine phosphatase SixA